MKNKILKILSLIAICALMIASLCSFTTVAPSDDSSYSDFLFYTSAMDLKVEYCYYRRTNTINQNYYGYFIDPNSTLVCGGDVKTIKNYASDYLVTGSKSFDYHSQTNQDLPSTYQLFDDYLLSEVVIASDDSATASFTGRFIYSGLQRISQIDEWNEICFYDEFVNGFNPIPLEDYQFTYFVSFVSFESGTYTRYEYSATERADCVEGIFGGINIRDVIDFVLEENEIDPSTYSFVDYIQVSSQRPYQFQMIKIIDVLRPETREGEREYSGLLAEWQNDILDYEASLTLMNENYKLLSSRYKNLESTLNAEREEIQKQLTAALERIKAFEEGKENASAITLLFDGIYKTIYNVLTIFFNMDFFGAKLGSVVGLLLGAAVVIIILKVVL